MKKLLFFVAFLFISTSIYAQTEYVVINRDNKAALAAGVPSNKIVRDVIDLKTGNVLKTLVELIDVDHYYPALNMYDYITFSFSSREEGINFFEGMYKFLGNKPSGRVIDDYQGFTISYSNKSSFVIFAPSSWMSGGEGYTKIDKAGLNWIIKSLKM